MSGWWGVPGEEWAWWEALRCEAVSERVLGEYRWLLADAREAVRVGLAAGVGADGC